MVTCCTPEIFDNFFSKLLVKLPPLPVSIASGATAVADISDIGAAIQYLDNYL